jgi:hypothetical protein
MANQASPLILRDRPPRWDPNKSYKEGFYRETISVQEARMALPDKSLIKVWIPEPQAARAYSACYAYNCVSHALGTFDPKTHTGYWIEMEDRSVWDVVESQKLTTRTKSFGGNYSELPKKGDLIFIWTAAELPNQSPAHKPIHAAIVVEAHFDDQNPQRLDETKTMVSTKNAEKTVNTRQSLRDMFRDHPDFRNGPGDQNCWTVHLLDDKLTTRLNEPFTTIEEGGLGPEEEESEGSV